MVESLSDIALYSLPDIALYTGAVAHARLVPVRHAFSYPIGMFLIDIDRLSRALRPLWPFAALDAWWAPVSFRDSDHMLHRPPGSTLSAAVRELVASKTGGALPTGRILLLTNLAYFGYCFNPISVYYVMSAQDPSALECIVAEVNNTPWNEQHCYVLHPGNAGVACAVSRLPGCSALSSSERLESDGAVPAADCDALCGAMDRPLINGGGGANTDAEPAAPVRFRHRYKWAKDFHVSPFMALDQHYDWSFTVPGGDTLLIQSANTTLPTAAVAAEAAPPPLPGSAGCPAVHGAGGSASGCPSLVLGSAAAPPGSSVAVFHTQLRLTRAQQLNAWSILWFAAVGFPLLTLRVQLWIHLEAMRLFLRGVPLVPHPTGASNGFTRAVEALVSALVSLLALLAPLKRCLGCSRC